MNSSHKAFFFTATSGLIVAMILSCLVFFWLLFPYKPIEFHDDVLPVLTEQVSSGDNLHYYVRMTKNTDKPAYITYQFVDGVIYTVPGMIESNLEEGEHEFISSTVEIPHSLASGPYRLRVNVSYQVNPLRTITVTRETETFYINHVE